MIQDLEVSLASRPAAIHVDKGYCGYNYRSLIRNLVYQALIDWRAVP